MQQFIGTTNKPVKVTFPMGNQGLQPRAKTAQYLSYSA